MQNNFLSLNEKIRLVTNVVSILNQFNFFLSERKINNLSEIAKSISRNKLIFTIYKKDRQEIVGRISFQNSKFNEELPGRVVWDIMLYKYKNEYEMKKVIKYIQNKVFDIKFRLLISGNN